VRTARFAVAHVPGLVLSGSKPRRDIQAAGGAEVRAALCGALRSFEGAVGYPPHQVVLGTLAPEALREIPRPWHLQPVAGARPEGPGGVMIDELGFHAWLARADTARLVQFDETFAEEVRARAGNLQISTMGAADLRREPDERQPDKCGRVLAFDEFEERYAQALDIEAARAVERLLDIVGLRERLQIITP